jgi:hypothetical protein
MNKAWLIIIAGIALVGCCALAITVVILVALPNPPGDTPHMARPDVTPSPIPLAPSFEEIRAQHDVMTEAQWKQYRTQIEGTQVVAWRGWVDEVTGNPGHYRVHIDMDSPDGFLSYAEVNFVVPDDLALSLQVDQSVMFSGQIETAQDFVGSLSIELEYAELQGN